MTSTERVRRWRAANPERARSHDRKYQREWRSKYPEHVSWWGMQERCYNPGFKQFKDYGGRGIQVCVRWHRSTPNAFQNFLSDLGKKPTAGHTVDRINNDIGYMPSNCRWATRLEQREHTRPIKLTKEQAREIRSMAGSHRSIAAIFGVDHSLIGLIKRGKCWRNV